MYYFNFHGSTFVLCLIFVVVVGLMKLEESYFKKWYFMDLKKKETLIKKHHKNLMNTMADFLNEYFPPPKPSDVNKTGKHRTRRQSMRATDPATELHALKSIIESLMNKCLETPHDAYLTVDDKFWQPYVTLLIRCNIAMFHPEDDKRIKLVPFHL
ncbi:centromere protein K-like isoform X2 [Liolophura sinensis]|uniref:centromere protein K-like isoform X2 n=1 Tax=Liolophura sinensis TaxID=3198878 RepID=UPI00315803D7